MHTNITEHKLSVDKTVSFLTALNTNKGIIFKISSIYTNNIEDRNDLAQEIIYQFWKSFDTFGQKSRVRMVMW